MYEYEDMYDLPFRASDYEPAEGLVPVPNGDYQVIVHDAEICRTRNSNGHLFKITYQITEGEYVNRKLWSQHNIDNPSEEAQHIARCEVSALAHAINRPDAERLQDYLHGRCQVAVVIQEDAGYAPKNVVKGWKTVDGQKPKRRAEFRGGNSGQERYRPVPGTAETGAAAGMERQTSAPARPFERAQGEPVTARKDSDPPSARTATGRPDGKELAGTESTHREHSQKTSTQENESQRRERIQELSRDGLGIPEPTDKERETLKMALDSIASCNSLEQLEQCGKDLQDRLHPELKGEAARVFREKRTALEKQR